MQILTLADDLTGALEAGAKFAQSRVRSIVAAGGKFDPDVCSGATAPVVDTETRHVSAAEAEESAAYFARAARAARVPWIYKKTDSTLRGNIGAELNGITSAFPGEPVLYAPAYPKLGRTVRAGKLYVDGIPAEASAFSHDPLNPVLGSDVAETLLRSGCRVGVTVVDTAHLASFAGSGVCLVDGEAEEDVLLAAEAFAHSGRFRIAAGPAAFAGQLARYLRHTGRSEALPTLRRCLVVNGSRNDVSMNQVEHARQLGWAACAASDWRPEAMEDWIIIDAHAGLSGSALAVAAQAGERVAPLLRDPSVAGIAVFGGDTAFGILRALGFPPLYPLGELITGVPLARIQPWGHPALAGRDAELYLITKAGGFGPVDVLSRIRARLAQT